MNIKKGDINNQGNPKDRIILNNDGDYCYPCEQAKYEVVEIGTIIPTLETGMVISQITGTEAYDPVIHRYIGCGNDEFEFPYIHRVRVHPIGYNYDNYHPQMSQGLNGIDYYAIDEIIETRENPNSTL